MELQPIFEATMSYDTPGAWRYGDLSAMGYAEGSGSMTGALIGSIRWSNRPWRREDGIWESDLRGYVETGATTHVLFEGRGRAEPETAPGVPRRLVASMAFTSCTSSYAWLDALVVVAEGSFDPLRGKMDLQGYACVVGLRETLQVTGGSGT